MEIIYYFAKYNSSMYEWQIAHILHELGQHNIKIEIFNPLEFESIEAANELLVRRIKQKSYDLFMTDQNRFTLFSDTVLRIREVGLPRLLIHFDNLMDPTRYIGYAKMFDLVMLLNKDERFNYNKYECPYIFTPYAANPFFFKDLRSTVLGRDGICFTGTPYGTRCLPINALLKKGVQVDLFANDQSIRESLKIASGLNIMQQAQIAFQQMKTIPGRKVVLGALLCKVKPPERLDRESKFLKIQNAVYQQRMNEVYSSFALALSMPEARNTGVLKRPVDVVRLRNFEIPMCAGLQISRYMEELGEYFEEDKEILFYRSHEELVEKVKFYSDPQHRHIVDKMKDQARRRAESEHTWYTRFSVAFTELGLTY